MAKYNFEFKLEVVEDYLRGKGGYKHLAKKYKIPSDALIVTWVKNYKAQGIEGLKRSRQNKKYTLDFKLQMIEYYLSTEVSYRDLVNAGL